MSLRYRLGRLCVRLAGILMAGALLMLLPGPASNEVLYIKNAAVAFFTVILIGKTMYDTFFDGE